MTDLHVPIYNLIKHIVRTELEFPEICAEFPLATITEIANVENYSVAGVELISDITFQIDVWDDGETPQRCEEIAGRINDIMTANLFTRTLGRGFRDPSGLWRKKMYFRTKNINV